jgi:hypothetical protein
LNWTITSATKSWSDDNNQALQGQRYITVTLKVDNHSSADSYGNYQNYIRLQSDSGTSAPLSNSYLPGNFPADTAGATGRLIFLMPDNSTDLTLILLETSSVFPPSREATINFQIS